MTQRATFYIRNGEAVRLEELDQIEAGMRTKLSELNDENADVFVKLARQLPELAGPLLYQPASFANVSTVVLRLMEHMVKSNIGGMLGVGALVNQEMEQQVKKLSALVAGLPRSLGDATPEEEMLSERMGLNPEMQEMYCEGRLRIFHLILNQPDLFFHYGNR